MKTYKKPSNPPEGTETLTPTQEAIRQIIKQLRTDVKTAHSQKKAACIDLGAAQKSYDFNACCYTKTKKSYQKYWEIDNCVTTTAVQDIEIIKTNIDTFIKDSDNLKKHFKEVVKKVKEAKGKLTEAKDATCKLSDCLDYEERCNPSIYDALVQGIVAGSGGQKLTDALEAITEQSKKAQETACVTFDATIKISGIQIFSNIASLKTFNDKLVEKITNLKKNVDTNLKNITDQSKKAQEDLTNSIKELSSKGHSKHSATNIFEGKKETKNHLKNMTCNSVQDNQVKLEDICEKVKNFSMTDDNSSGSTGNDESDMWD